MNQEIQLNNTKPGALTTIRTQDLLITSELLYQLSYKGDIGGTLSRRVPVTIL